MGHNEDGSPIDLPTGYLVKAQVMEESGSVENFFAYCYAGQLCGNAFGYNGKGVVTTVNAVFPKNLNTSSIGKCGRQLESNHQFSSVISVRSHTQSPYCQMFLYSVFAHGGKTDFFLSHCHFFKKKVVVRLGSRLYT